MIPLKIDLGCGRNEREGWLGVDCRSHPNVQIVWDFKEGLRFLNDASVDALQASHLLEHLPNLLHFMGECWRVLKPGATFEIIVPAIAGPENQFYPGAFSDPEHCRYFTFGTFDYFCADTDPGRYMADRGYTAWFEIVSRSYHEDQFLCTLKKPDAP